MTALLKMSHLSIQTSSTLMPLVDSSRQGQLSGCNSKGSLVRCGGLLPDGRLYTLFKQRCEMILFGDFVFYFGHFDSAAI